MYEQLEIRWVDLEPTKGAETRKKRPCVILQDDVVNYGTKTIIVAPILPNRLYLAKGKDLPTIFLEKH